MKLSQKIVFSIAFSGAVVLIYKIVSWTKNQRMLNQIAAEGYETAHDILFPGKLIPSKNIQYGPVIPG